MKRNKLLLLTSLFFIMALVLSSACISSGERGRIGATGAKGDKGDTGSVLYVNCSDTVCIMNQTPNLTAGVNGYTPVFGTDYFNGSDGYTPIKGVDYFDGTNGSDGYTPIKGVDYFDGTNGIDGTNGNDGYTPVFGVDYFNGSDGYTPVFGVDYFNGSKGDKGDNGYTPVFGTDYFNGSDGYTPIKGVDYFDGINGTNGTSATVEVNYTFTGYPPNVVNVGTNLSAKLDFTIPYDANVTGAWQTWSPTKTFGTNPLGSYVETARYRQVGKTVEFHYYIYTADGNGTSSITITLPVTPKNIAARIVFSSSERVDNTYYTPIAENLATGSNTIYFHNFVTMTDAKTCDMSVSGFYEVD